MPNPLENLSQRSNHSLLKMFALGCEATTEGEHLVPDGGGNPISGRFVPMDGGGIAFQEDVVPDIGGQARITGGNPPKCPDCGQSALPDGAIYRCPNCGNEIGVS